MLAALRLIAEARVVVDVVGAYLLAMHRVDVIDASKSPTPEPEP